MHNKGIFFAEDLNRRISTLELQVAYQEDTSFEHFIHQTVGLVFVPLQFVRLAWQAVKVTAPDLPKVDEFAAYFKVTLLVVNFFPR